MNNFKTNIIKKFIELEDILLSSESSDLQTLSDIAYIIETNKYIVLDLLSGDDIDSEKKKEVSSYYNDLKIALNL